MDQLGKQMPQRLMARMALKPIDDVADEGGQRFRRVALFELKQQGHDIVGLG